MAEISASQIPDPRVFVGDVPVGITGIKFRDDNGNGIQDANEPGLAGVTIFIDTNNNATLDTGERSVVTPAGGNFTFSNLVPGTYVVREVVPNGFRPTTPQSLVVTLNNTDARISFGNSPSGSQIIGCKFLDVDNDGFRDGNEPGIEGVRIYIDNNNNNTFDAGETFTYTNRDGSWQFSNLNPGLYRIREERINTNPLERDFPQSTPPNNIPNLDINLGLNEIWACANIGNTQLYEIPIFKFRDTNRNGTFDPAQGETPIANVPFILDINRNGVYDVGEPLRITNADGRTSFRDLRATNSYSLREIFPGLQANGQPALIPGTNIPTGNASDPVSTTTNPREIAIPGPLVQAQSPLQFAIPDTNAVNGIRVIKANFAPTFPPTNPDPSVTFAPVPASGTSSGGVGNTRPNITVFKYNDQNVNGRFDQGEAGIAGVQVYIDANDNGVVDAGEQSVTTNSAGQAAFTNLPAGNYVVREVVPTGFTATMPTRVQFSLSTSDARVEFGNALNSRITGCKFEDLNNNGYKDGNEKGIAGVTIALDLNGNNVLDAGEPTVVSDTFGNFSFNNLAPGLYRLREVTPTGAIKTTQKLDINLGANQEFGCAVVGNGLLYNLNVVKFRDDNRNGIQDNGEGPLENIPFLLDLNRNGVVDAGEQLVRTSAAGIATFTNVAPGTYDVLEVFNDPNVANPFPIPTGPNPVTFNVPGSNTVRVTTNTATPNTNGTTPLSSASIDLLTGNTDGVSISATEVSSDSSDPLTDSGSVNPLSPTSGADSLLVSDTTATFVDTTKTEDAFSSLSIVPQDPLTDDKKLLLTAPTSAQVF
ncbi:MAG TPA: SdrD B-like domain-containing protein [Kamptonema sp.]|nr:SdrD B-like domain-containing protein [Kamptonema sp.]